MWFDESKTHSTWYRVKYAFLPGENLCTQISREMRVKRTALESHVHTYFGLHTMLFYFSSFCVAYICRLHRLLLVYAGLLLIWMCVVNVRSLIHIRTHAHSSTYQSMLMLKPKDTIECNVQCRRWCVDSRMIWWTDVCVHG